MLVSRKMNVLLVAVFLFSLIAGGFQAPVFAAEGENKASVTVIGDEAAGTMVDNQPVPIAENATALDILSSAVGGDLVTSDTAWGKSLDEIKGLAPGPEDTYFWAFYVNGFSSDLGAGSYTAQNGDHYTFRYEDWNKPVSASIKVIGKNKEVINESKYNSFVGKVSALQLLQKLMGKERVSFDKDGFLSINNINAEGTYYWAFYVNDEYASTGADSYFLQPNDQITFQYESWEQPSDNEGDGDGVPNENTGNENNQPPSEPIASETLQNAIDTTLTLFPDEYVGEKEAVVLRQLGKSIPTNYLDNVTKLVIDKKGVIRNILDTEGYILGIVAAGGDPTNIGGYNLISSIYTGDVVKPGLNGVAYALIALDSMNFEIPATATWTREKLVNYLLDSQNKDGSWSGANADIDITAMVLQALSPYKDQAGVSEAVNKGVENLSSVYLSGKIDNSNTAAQVIIALSALGIDPNGETFTKGGTSIVSYLLSFKVGDNGFEWKHGKGINMLASSQSLQALVAYQLYRNGKGSLYNFTLAPESPAAVQPTTVALNQDAKTESPEGKLLPNTATNMYNTIFYGMLILMVGMVAVIVMGKRKSA
ncbi:DUF4430 domain-containing protein [Bacillus sp. 1NLA3E]|uniref:DUF4430 domain-containing protein n=1 Tax=Bacillus sp. 1NLA3E TaxID=666686 RepID=UPI000247E38C|nr:DUF4430 domain-containing protein [Bacillus sp. 1NLA3E]AGK52635.1 cell wall anchor domain-containing protein [Bacillus sp. 1NLA3E]